MPWTYAIVGLLVGCVVGVIISRITGSLTKNQKSVQKELDGAKLALEEQRQEIMDHFSQTADMLDTIGKDYTKLYKHMAKTSSVLIPNVPEHDNPFIKSIEKSSRVTHEVKVDETSDAENPPKDYAKGSSGLLKGNDKSVVNEKEALKNQK